MSARWCTGGSLPGLRPSKRGFPSIALAPTTARGIIDPAGARPAPIIERRSKGRPIKFLRMKPGHGEVLLAEGDPRGREEEERLVEAFRRQLDEGMWAAVPTTDPRSGRREAQMVKEYAEIPADAERVIFFPRASGG